MQHAPKCTPSWRFRRRSGLRLLILTEGPISNAGDEEYCKQDSSSSSDIVQVHLNQGQRCWGSLEYYVNWDRHSTTVKKIVEGCVYIRRRFYAISLMRGELQHSALCSFSPLCPLIQQEENTRQTARWSGHPALDSTNTLVA